MKYTARITLVVLLALTGCVPAVVGPAVSGSAQKDVVTAQQGDPVTNATPVLQPLTTLPARSPTGVPIPVYLPHACQPAVQVLEGHFWLVPPIGLDSRHTVDKTYRYGHTLNGERDPHTGVEFPNRAGTLVLAAADGQVVFAGADSGAELAPWPDYYGNAVVIEHQFQDFEQPVFTLYAHLSSISVSVGEPVTTGQLVGAVGSSGVAIGSHLHFEVRVGENSFTATQNPELWLIPDGDNGALAGWVVDPDGELILVNNFVLAPSGSSSRIYFESYKGGLSGDLVWEESFGLGELPSGEYELAFSYGTIFRQTLTIMPGQLTLVAFCTSG